jgi:hypothetical protein
MALRVQQGSMRVLLLATMVACGATVPAAQGPATTSRPSSSTPIIAESARPSSHDPHPAATTTMPPNARALWEQVASIRGLVPKRAVEIETLDDDAFERRYAESVPVPAALRARALATWTAFGFIPGGSDAYATRKTAFAGFYDPPSQKIVIRQAQGHFNEPALLVHEMAHALQDQYFGIDRFARIEDNEDAMLARKAVLEGDATLVAEAWAAEAAGERGTDAIARAAERVGGLPEQEIVQWVGAESRLLARPAIAWKPLVFAYYTGLQFLASLRSPFQFATVNKAFEAPPSTTEQVLHPGAYSAHEAPLALDQPAAEESTVLARGSLGEYRISLMLQHCGPTAREVARAAAAGWGNDHYVVTALPKERAALQWVTRWDTPEDAEAFHRALNDAVRCYPKAASSGLHVETEIGLAIVGDRVSYVRGMPHAARIARALLGVP